MAQILDTLPPDQGEKILCCYVNATSKIQVARISNIPNWYFERVVFPGQRLVLESLAMAQLEIHTGTMASAILSDTIPCIRLAVKDNNDELEYDSVASIDTTDNQTIMPSINTTRLDKAKPSSFVGLVSID
ncbi:MAG: DUF1830 domain-containing protein [Richelia sp.]|nr:DUF1830 domain-containing protein [Richelia sp.]CDN12496.1 FIG00874945: hypothetical protein [Richelia intracellularis]